MSIQSKYSCGCSSGTNTKSFDDGCCAEQPQTPPSPCCEAHTVMYKTGFCLYPTSNVTANATTFYIQFENLETNGIPLHGDIVHLVSAELGFLKILAVKDDVVTVALKDLTRVGAILTKGVCVGVGYIDASGAGVGIQRCLTGLFNPPLLNDPNGAVIFIHNGSGIPIGSTITFTANGVTGSYLVSSFISASSNTYSYKVLNSGAGHLPNVTIDAGAVGTCTIPLEIVNDIDFCTLSKSTVLSSVVGCLNGSPRAGMADGPNQSFVSRPDGKFELTNITNLDCCVTTVGCLKFNQNTVLCSEFDTVTLVAPVPACFVSSFNRTVAQNNAVIVNIAGVKFVATALDATANTITLSPATTGYLEGSATFRSYPAGTKICFGECCNKCVIDGKEISNFQEYLNPNTSLNAGYSFNLVNQALQQPGSGYYLLGSPNGGPILSALQVINALYNDNPDPGGPKIPKITDNLILRQKICNTSDKGCPQRLKFTYNYELAVSGLPDKVRFHYEVGSYIAPSATLSNGTTPNPFNNISSKAKSAGSLMGPSSVETEFITNTSIGFGGITETKVYPYEAREFTDSAPLGRCDCASAVVWFFFKTELLPGYTTIPGAAFSIAFNIRRIVEREEVIILQNPPNLTSQEGFKQ